MSPSPTTTRPPVARNFGGRAALGRRVAVCLGWLCFSILGPAGASEDRKEKDPEQAKQIHRCAPGPWGDLEYYVTFLEAPEHFVPDWPDPGTETFWRFVDL